MTAEIILDSINPYTGIRLTTLHLIYPQSIHPEFLTHRVFSRNSSSGRAISYSRFEKQQRPTIIWTKERKGMQGERLNPIDIDDYVIIKQADVTVDNMHNMVLHYCNQLKELGIHHQDINDFLKPFRFIHTIVTATDWDNFFNQRLDYDNVKPAMFELALEIKSAMNSSSPIDRYYHTPFVDVNDFEKEDDAFLVSAANCARISYQAQGTVESNIALGRKLIEKQHPSPFEHAAVASEHLQYYNNLNSWRSYRNMKGF